MVRGWWSGFRRHYHVGTDFQVGQIVSVVVCTVCMYDEQKICNIYNIMVVFGVG